jgi:hypothetical protein
MEGKESFRYLRVLSGVTLRKRLIGRLNKGDEFLDRFVVKSSEVFPTLLKRRHCQTNLGFDDNVEMTSQMNLYVFDSLVWFPASMPL